MIKKNLFLFAILFVLSGMTYSQEKYFMEENIDKSVNPGDDFFLYANGNFIKRNPIPASESVYGIFNLITDDVYEYLKKICIDDMNDNTAVKGSNTQKIGDFFFSGMDSAGIEKQGAGPLKKWMEKIDRIKDVKDVLKVAAELHTAGVGPLYIFYTSQDDMQSSVYKAFLYQGGIGLPNRDYYFKDDERTKNIRAKYIKHIENLLLLIGYKPDEAKNAAKEIMKLETQLAKSSRKLEELRDSYANYNRRTFKELSEITPSINWREVFNIYGVKKTDTVIVCQPEFFAELEKVLNDYDIDVLKDYLKWNLIDETAGLLSNKFSDEHFDFHGKVLSGTTEQRPRFKRVLDNTNDLLGEILGMEYVRIYFSPEDKARTRQMVDNVFDAFAERVRNLDWMSEETKQKALLKLGTVDKKIGYPDKWKDYSTLEISRNSYLTNIFNARNWEFKKNIAKMDKPVDKTEWHMNPQTCNAYYSSSNNEIVLPVAIMTVPGKKMSELDDAFLYGYVGASTIGHELTHGFDDEGRNYDADGNLKGWWTAEDSAKFVSKAQKLVEQFDNFVVLENMHVNGKATLGENIADLAGLVLGFEALKKTKEWQEKKVIGGFTVEQRYFLGYAFSWAVYYRDELLARRIMTDVHSPPFLRINGPMSNLKEFYEAFGVKEGDKLYRQESERVKIW
ncbi:MAG: M13 family metallopeptidase [Ignavibacteriae bacterium]|nr:M13 family metallopeptidase [Ignavibacteriota bacterium]